jgi:hypothetical protein
MRVIYTSKGMSKILGRALYIRCTLSIEKYSNFVFKNATYLNLLGYPEAYKMYGRKLILYLTLFNPIFLPTAYSPALICFGRERGWWISCNYPTVLKEKNIEKQKEYNPRCLLAKVRTT